MSKTKTKNIISPAVNLMLNAISHHIILIIGNSILLGGSGLRDKFLGVYGVDAKFIECIYDEDFIFYGRN